MWRSVHSPACPTNSSSHFCLKKSVTGKKPLTHKVFVMKINNWDYQPSRPRLQNCMTPTLTWSHFLTWYLQISPGLIWFILVASGLSLFFLLSPVSPVSPWLHVICVIVSNPQVLSPSVR